MAGTTKRAVAACCLLVIVLVQQQASAMSKFCRCYNKCYTDCRKTLGPYPCNLDLERLQDCINGQPPPLPRPASIAADCNYACLIRICGVMDTAMATAGDAEACLCLSDCTNKLGACADAPASATKTN